MIKAQEEPAAGLAARPLLCAFLATRPAFLSITVPAVAIGWACATRAPAGLPRGFDLAAAAMTLIFALAAHAGANVVNDFHDVDTDAANNERLYPFTGGSRFIQNGVMRRATVGWLGYGLLFSVAAAGMWLMLHAGGGLLWIGLAGLFLAWAYSAPPLRLAARGVGELGVAVGWTLIAVGSDFVQRQTFAIAPLAAGAAYGLMVACLLFINQFPDANADRAVGKLTLVARVGRARAVRGYAWLAGLAALVLLLSVAAGALPLAALAALLAMAPMSRAYAGLRRNARRPGLLAGPIRLTIVTVHLFGLLLAATLFFT